MSAALMDPPAGVITPPPRPKAGPHPLVAVPNDALGRLTVAQYDRMVREGILTEGEPVELLRGLLVRKMPKNTPHNYACDTLIELLANVCPGWCSKSQNPIVLADGKPEPDFVLTRGGRKDYSQRDPAPADIGLLVEVANTSYEVDRFDKYVDYALAGVPVYWIVDVGNKKVEVFTNPDPEAGEYRTARTFAPGDAVPVELDGVQVGEVPAAELFA